MDSPDGAERHKIADCIFQGNVALSKNQLGEAAKLFQQAYQMLIESGVQNSAEVRQCLKTLTEINTKQKKLDQALKHIKALRKIYDCTEYRRTYITLLASIAAGYDKEGDRTAAEEAFKSALNEASYLLPKNDPLTEQLNNACLEIFKRTIKSRSISVADERVVLSRLQLECLPEPKPEEAPATPAAKLSVHKVQQEDCGSISRRLNHLGLPNMAVVLQSSTFSIALSLLLFACFTQAALFAPSWQTAERAPALINRLQGQQFESCDKLSTFCLLGDNQCVITRQNLNCQCRYRIIENSMGNPISMLRGYLTRTEFWYQVAPAGIVDPDKTLLYSAQAPELAVVRKMWWYADFAQKWFAEKHSYPTDLVRCEKKDKDFPFLNPFSGQVDAAAIVKLGKMSADLACSARTEDGSSSMRWRPGAIFCFCVNRTAFVIHGCDRFGNLLTASDHKHYFVVACNDGANVTKANLVRQSFDTKSELDNKKVTVYICSNAEQEATIRYMRNLSCSLCWLASLLATFWCVSNYKLKQSLKRKTVSIAVSLICYCTLAAWYILAFAPN